MIWGVFDSGVGGLTVVRALVERMPRVSLVYLGDTARVPYGIRSRETVRRYAREAAHFFRDARVDGVVVACNTASAVALQTFGETFGGPVLGVVEPGVEAALAASESGSIGVIGTAATIRSDAYGLALRRAAPESRVTSTACPLFVPLAEEGWVEGELPELAARTYLEPLAGAGIDTLILGCTHYPLLKETIGRAMTALGDPGVTLVDSAEAVAARAAASVASSGGRFDDPPRRRFCVTDAGGAFLDVARRILDDPGLTLETVELDAHEAGAHRVD